MEANSVGKPPSSSVPFQLFVKSAFLNFTAVFGGVCTVLFILVSLLTAPPPLEKVKGLCLFGPTYQDINESKTEEDGLETTASLKFDEQMAVRSSALAKSSIAGTVALLAVLVGFYVGFA
jgi:hypothetical protein